MLNAWRVGPILHAGGLIAGRSSFIGQRRSAEIRKKGSLQPESRKTPDK